ncbi:MAG: dienelactone hydrolase family protein [Gemmatimonadetes bacterium]|nr:dienelactone hydrolase family protein [Gemmatimonadota bacterium]
MFRFQNFVTVLCVFATASACGPEAQNSGDDIDTSSPRIALSPTGPGEMPPAIIGNRASLGGAAVRYVTGDAHTIGYLAVPEGDGPFPALVIIHEWNGLVDRVREVADDFAAEGYVTLAADLYRGAVGTNPEENITLMNAATADMSTVVGNLNAAVAFLRARSDVTGRVGAMGWCFGGGIALSFGLDGVDHEATAIFYGRLIDDPEALARMDHEVYGTFASLDSGPSPEQVTAFQSALEAAGIENDLHIYDEVNHGFWLRIDQDVPGRGAAGLDAWNRLKAYLDRTLND